MEPTEIVIVAISVLILGLEGLYFRYRYRKQMMDILREHLLNPRWTWRTFEGMMRAIRQDAETTKQLLFEIKARPSEMDKDVWKLEER